MRAPYYLFINAELLTGYRRDLLHIRMQVDAFTSNAVIVTQLQQDLREHVLDIVTQHQGDMSLSLDRVNSTVDQRLERIEELVRAQEARFYDSQENRLGPNYGVAAQHQRRRSRARKGDPQLPFRADAVGVRLTRYATACRTGCPCLCHKENRSATPAFLDRVFGQLFLGFSGVPGLSQKCNDASCERSQTAHVNLEYWFPLGVFWSQIVRLHAGYQHNVGPQFQMTLMRRIPDNAQAVEFALAGDTDGLKHLFSRGLASTRDVSSTRGYTLLRWALYGNQFQTANFLLRTGSDPDYAPTNPYDFTPKNKAYDRILRGNLTKDDEAALRPLALGSEWVDDQNYTLVHRCVLGLSSASLEDAIMQHAAELEAVDTLGRTALCWAAARGDDRAVTVLLAAGADPNAIDHQLQFPLEHAADGGHTRCVRLLLEAGAETDPPRPNGLKLSSALNHAARDCTDPLCLKTLLDFGADIESCGIDGRTSLIHVARRDNVSFALLLLEYGADVNATSITGQTPLTTAIMHNSHGVMRLLLERWFEYSECPRLHGGHLLQIVAEYADHETISILMGTDHLRLRYDKEYGLVHLAEQLQSRLRADEKLSGAFQDLLDVINNDPYANKTDVESLAEARLLRDRARTIRATGAMYASSSDSSVDEEFEDALEHLNIRTEKAKEHMDSCSRGRKQASRACTW